MGDFREQVEEILRADVGDWIDIRHHPVYHDALRVSSGSSSSRCDGKPVARSGCAVLPEREPDFIHPSKGNETASPASVVVQKQSAINKIIMQ
mmetsp:Transcript_11903/g.28213  ORF Transcript_11903/g.28213 Transcript_11903/m.28213 type:complete len:93 (+) Transcript_11903:1200-1478(+)